MSLKPSVPVLDAMPACLPACAGELICHCRKVEAQQVRAVIDDHGAQSVDEITLRTGAGASCRGCVCRLQRMLAGLEPSCPRFGMCVGCGCIRALCRCAA